MNPQANNYFKVTTRDEGGSILADELIPFDDTSPDDRSRAKFEVRSVAKHLGPVAVVSLFRATPHVTCARIVGAGPGWS